MPLDKGDLYTYQGSKAEANRRVTNAKSIEQNTRIIYKLTD